MPQTIKIKRSTTAGAVPVSLAAGELAANVADGKLFLGATAGVVEMVEKVNGQAGTVTLTPANLGAIAAANKGVANGVASLDATGQVPASELGNAPAAPVVSVAGKVGAVTLVAADAGAIPAAEKAAANGVASLDATGNVPLAELTNSPAIFKQFYESPQQTITTSGLLTLAHGLGVKPKLVTFWLHCVIAAHGYAIGDEVIVPSLDITGGTGRGVSIVPDATNLVIRFGYTGVFTVLEKTGGANTPITLANWKLIVRAWA